MLRLVSTSAAVRAIASPKFRFITPIANAYIERPNLSDHRRFSTDSGSSAARKVVGALKSQIKAHEQALINSRGAPANLPFTVEDNDQYCHIMLTRDFGDEKIEVTVNPVHETSETDPTHNKAIEMAKKALYSDSDTSDSDSHSDSDSDSSASESEAEAEAEKKAENATVEPWQPRKPKESVTINVSISKENKGTLDIKANVSAVDDGFFVERVSFTEPNNYVPSLTYSVEPWTDLEVAFRQLIEERGIEQERVGFLYNYMVEKRKRWGTVWLPGKKPETDDLKKLKKFFEDWNQ